MDALIGFVVIAGVVIAVGIAGVLALVRARHRAAPDEFIRAGAGSEPSPAQAAEAASRRTAWMQPDGGGGL